MGDEPKERLQGQKSSALKQAVNKMGMIGSPTNETTSSKASPILGGGATLHTSGNIELFRKPTLGEVL